jgi:glycosyltransferase involved in cell wall biosynthesis
MLSGHGPSVTVLMIADAIGGIWTYALDLARALERDGIRTVLATMGPHPSNTQRSAAEAVPGLILEVKGHPLEWMDVSASEIEQAGRWLLDLERAHRPDLIHLNGFAHAALPFTCPVLVAAHSCIGTWWPAVRGEAPPARYHHYIERVRRGLGAADAVVAPSRAYLDDLERVHGSLRNAVVIPNGRDPAGFGPGAKREMVFSAGRVWDEAKNVMALDAIAAGLPWPVVVAGDWRPAEGAGSPPETLLCLDLVEPDRLRQWYAEAAIFALPARYEPFGLAALEAALSGCALVLGDLASQREIWGDAALYVPPNDHTALRRTLERLICEPVVRQRMAEHAMRRAQRYTAGRMGRDYARLYHRLIPDRAEPIARPGAAVLAPS